MSHFIDLLQSLTGSLVSRVHAERIGGNNCSAVNNDNIVVSMKFEDGSIASLTYSASGDKAYSREALEVFTEGTTLVCKDFRVSMKYFGGKKESFKTQGQQMGYQEELKHFTNCVLGTETPIVSLEEAIATIHTIFSIERSLSIGKTVSV